MKRKESKKSKYLESVHQAVSIRMLRKIESLNYPVMCAGDMNAAKRGPRAIAEARLTGMAPGEPDIRVYLPDGKLLMFELKTERGRLSKDQVARHESLLRLGHVVDVMSNLEPADTAIAIGRHVAFSLGIDAMVFDDIARKCANEVIEAIGAKA